MKTTIFISVVLSAIALFAVASHRREDARCIADRMISRGIRSITITGERNFSAILEDGTTFSGETIFRRAR